MDELRSRLERWVTAGAIDRAQADAILAFEAAREEPSGRRRAIAAEALGYVGGTLALVAAVVIGAGRFSGLSTAGKSIFLIVVTAALLAAGWWLRTAASTTLRRLGSLLWFLSVAACAGLGEVWSDSLSNDRLDDGLLNAVMALVLAAVLWFVERRALQQVALFLSLTATFGSLADTAIGFGQGRQLVLGAGFLLLGGLWLELSRRGLVLPRRTAEALGALALIGGDQSLWAGENGWALGLGLAVALGLIVAGSAGRRPVLLGLGAAALLLFLAEVAGDYWTSLGAPLVFLLIGLTLVAAAVLIAKLQPARRETAADR
jgi:hypothetical protein